MKKLFALLLALMMLLALSACGQAKTDKTPAVVGGWTVTEGAALSDEAKAALDKALEGLTGVSYEPVALLGTQVVSGTNYCILCQVTPVVPDAKPAWALVYVYADLEGNAEIMNVYELYIDKHAQ